MKDFWNFILPDDTVTVDLEVMTLTGVHVYKRDKNCIKKQFSPWCEENTPPPEFLRKKLGRPKEREIMNF